jgi:peptidoglycan hydrolase-like protein with peptidoglycan-binding domain
MSQPIGSLANFTPVTRFARLGHGALGDMVVWAQEHLVTAGQRVKVDGSFGSATLNAVKRFQLASGLSASGLIDTTTWRLLLRYAPAPVHWTMHSKQLAAAASAAGETPVPKNASVRAVRNEIAGPGGVARGRR